LFAEMRRSLRNEEWTKKSKCGIMEKATTIWTTLIFQTGWYVPYKTSVAVHDILVWIRGSMPLTNGSGSGCGSGSCDFRHWPWKCQQKTNFFLKVFCLVLFEGTFTSFFKDKKSKSSHKAVGINGFLTIFA
jgi:hypothetical protein